MVLQEPRHAVPYPVIKSLAQSGNSQGCFEVQQTTLVVLR